MFKFLKMKISEIFHTQSTANATKASFVNEQILKDLNSDQYHLGFPISKSCCKLIYIYTMAHNFLFTQFM